MKIKKRLVEAEESEPKLAISDDTEKKLSEIDPTEASVSEIADAVQASVENTTGDDATLSDANAAKVAQEIKDTSQEIGAEQAAIIPPESVEDKYETKNELTKILDKALGASKRHMRRKQQGQSVGKIGTNVLVTGLPGSGKTAIVYAWAKARGLNVMYLDAKDPNLETVINGMPMRDITATDRNAVVKAYGETLKPLERPNSVLFLDELNRQVKDHIRASLLSLINEKVVSGNDEKGLHDFSDTLLFTVACINPSVPTDKGAAPLSDAEKSRFVLQTTYNSNVPAAIDFFQKYFDRLIDKLDVNDQYYKDDLTDYLKGKDLIIYILSHKDFAFDTVDDLEELSDGHYTMLNQRLLTDAIAICGGDKGELLAWVDENSNLRPEAKEMLDSIIASYTLDINKLMKSVNKEVAAAEAEAKAEEGQPAEEPTAEEEEEDDDNGFWTSQSSGRVAPNPSTVLTDVADILQGW